MVAYKTYKRWSLTRGSRYCNLTEKKNWYAGNMVAYETWSHREWFDCICFHFSLVQVVQLAGIYIVNHVITSMILQLKVGVMLEKLAKVGV